MKKKFLFKRKTKNKEKNSALKGMTLLEVIIAMVVLVIMAAMVATASVGIITNLRTSKSVIDKVNYQGRYVTGEKKKYASITGYDESSGTYSTVEKDVNSKESSFELLDKDDKPVGKKAVTIKIYEAPGMADAYEYRDGTYKMSDGSVYDKAGNLKYFEYTK